ncbi:MAG: hypothetical protein WCO84_03495 [bacterium]
MNNPASVSVDSSEKFIRNTFKAEFLRSDSVKKEFIRTKESDVRLLKKDAKKNVVNGSVKISHISTAITAKKRMNLKTVDKIADAVAEKIEINKFSKGRFESSSRINVDGFEFGIGFDLTFTQNVGNGTDTTGERCEITNPNNTQEKCLNGTNPNNKFNENE